MSLLECMLHCVRTQAQAPGPHRWGTSQVVEQTVGNSAHFLSVLISLIFVQKEEEEGRSGGFIGQALRLTLAAKISFDNLPLIEGDPSWGNY